LLPYCDLIFDLIVDLIFDLIARQCSVAGDALSPGR